MNRRAQWTLTVAVAIGSLIAAPSMHGQGYTTIYQSRVSIAPKLAGQVVAAADRQPLTGVRVDLCRPGWRDVLRTVRTDARGKFSFNNGEDGDLLYLRLSSPGFDPYKLRVRIDTHSRSKLVILLVAAT